MTESGTLMLSDLVTDMHVRGDSASHRGLLSALVGDSVNNETKDSELRQLFVDAFANARAKGKPDWQVMQIPVLNNRLLQQTGRQFRAVNYGAKTIQALVERFPDILALQDGLPPSVLFLVETRGGGPLGREDQSDSGGSASVRGSDETGFGDVLDNYRMNGDNLGVGEAYASRLPSVDRDDVERIFVNIVSRWGSSSYVDVELKDIEDLLNNVDRFVDDLLARAVVHATLRVEDAGHGLPPKVGDLNYRVAGSLRSLFNIGQKTRPAEPYCCIRFSIYPLGIERHGES